MRDELTDALRAVAVDDAARMSAAVDGRLLAEFRAMHPRPQRVTAARGVGLAIAAALVFAMAVPLWLVVRGGIPATKTARPAPAREVTTPFLPLAYSTVPTADAQIVRLAVPRSALVSLGVIPIDSADATSDSTATIVADVIVGEDGLARAVRFVRRR